MEVRVSLNFSSGNMAFVFFLISGFLFFLRFSQNSALYGIFKNKLYTCLFFKWSFFLTWQHLLNCRKKLLLLYIVFRYRYRQIDIQIQIIYIYIDIRKMLWAQYFSYSYLAFQKVYGHKLCHILCNKLCMCQVIIKLLFTKYQGQSHV